MHVTKGGARIYGSGMRWVCSGLKPYQFARDSPPLNSGCLTWHICKTSENIGNTCLREFDWKSTVCSKERFLWDSGGKGEALNRVRIKARGQCRVVHLAKQGKAK